MWQVMNTGLIQHIAWVYADGAYKSPSNCSHSCMEELIVEPAERHCYL